MPPGSGLSGGHQTQPRGPAGSKPPEQGLRCCRGASGSPWGSWQPQTPTSSLGYTCIPRNDPHPEKNPGRERGEMPTLGGGTYPKIHHHVGSGVLRGSAVSAGGQWAALGAAPPPRWALSPRALAVRLQRQGPAWRGALPLASLPGTAWALAVGRPRFRARRRRPTCCRRAAGEPGPELRGHPGAQWGRGLFTPGQKKQEREG